jgi:phospholipid-translocating ATPase
LPQIFPIFGASNPAMNAVPLIVILAVTAVKDAIEDWRRTVLDNELNNAPVHRLVDFNNVNTAEDSVSLWRRIKKATTRAIIWTWRIIKNSKKGDKGKQNWTKEGESRPSIDTRRASVLSQHSAYFDTDHGSHGEEGIQMTPVPSPLPGQSPPTDAVNIKGSTHIKESATAGHVSPGKFWGSVMNPYKQTPGKARFKKDAWKNVQVGDFIRLYNDEEVPADVIVLSTSSDDGACYVETKNLDGETNLKVRNALHCTRDVKHARHCEQAEFVIESEGPHSNLYSYSAVIRWKQQSKDPEQPAYDMAEPVSINNLLLRGCQLRNTEWALGVVVFTGEDTKIVINSGITPSKRAKISKDLNWNVIYNFILLFGMCLVSGIVLGVFWAKPDTSHAFFEFGSYGDKPATDGVIAFWAAIILFQNLVPISLYITLEIIRTAQAFFIYSDVLMYYEPVDYPCTPKSWNISDDVGQIEYIFSDKTGTLTQNVMEFKKCTVNGVPYGEAYTEAQAGMQRRQGIDVEKEGARAREQIARDRVRMIESIRKMHDNPYLLDENLTFVAPDYIGDLTGESGPEQKYATEKFMLALALCHTVITERTPGDPPRIEFKAQSPDEAALVATARDVGFTLIGREDDKLVLNVLGEERRYQVLNTLEFNSSRKRMSAIIRMPDGKIMLFCKGADSMIYSRLIAGEQRELRQATGEHLEMFAREGLRTLCIAQREISEEEYQEWSRDYDIAANAVAGREEKLEEVSDRIENELWLLGGTAIEDRLQDGVPDAISLLGKAGIKLWVLTGDKVETAINIGFSCNLLDNDMDLIILKVEDESLATAEKLLDEKLAIFGMTGSQEELDAAQDDHEPPAPTHAIIIDGDSLKLVLDESIRRKFLLLCKQCRSVLCCRVSPSQKAAVVNMVKNGLDCLTLAIGDGANDVAMIQEAHVGVGIAGVEGRAAVMSSDYAIGQFRFLTRLVLVHGRWSYRRLAETIANFFYKASLKCDPIVRLLTSIYRTLFGRSPFSGTRFIPISTASISSTIATLSFSTWLSLPYPSS